MSVCCLSSSVQLTSAPRPPSQTPLLCPERRPSGAPCSHPREASDSDPGTGRSPPPPQTDAQPCLLWFPAEGRAASFSEVQGGSLGQTQPCFLVHVTVGQDWAVRVPSPLPTKTRASGVFWFFTCTPGSRPPLATPRPVHPSIAFPCARTARARRAHALAPPQAAGCSSWAQ